MNDVWEGMEMCAHAKEKQRMWVYTEMNKDNLEAWGVIMCTDAIVQCIMH